MSADGTEKFGIVQGVVDDLLEDVAAFEAYRAMLPDMWRDRVRAVGGRLTDDDPDPTIEETPNMSYGWELDDGEGGTYVDHIKVYLRVSGRAYRS